MINKILLPLVLLVLLSTSLLAEIDEPHARFEAKPSKTELKAGEDFFIKVNFDVDKYWYTYDFIDLISDEGIGPARTEIVVLSSELAEATGDVIKPTPIKKFDEGFEMDVTYYKGNFDVILPVKALKDFTIGKEELLIEIYLQLCDTTSCLAAVPYNVVVSSETYDASQNDNIIVASTERLEKSKEHKKDEKIITESSAEIEESKKKGIWSFLWFAMLAGAGALLTPCVFPMVPITVSFFTKRAEKSKSRGLRDSTIYALGIIGTFTGIGFALAAILGPTGIRDFAADAWVNMAIATIFIVFALNLFGAFEIQIPTSIMNKLNKQTQGSGIGSILAMGVVFSLTSFTCTVPFVGSTIITAATGGEWFYPIIGMLGFSTVFALPFFVFALIPSAMNKLPKAGGWMNNVKVVMGFIEVAAAVKFISNVDLVWGWGIMPREMFISIWIVCGILIVAYLLGAFKMKMDSDINNLGALRVIWAIVFGAITVFLIPGLFGKNMGELDAFLPPRGYLNANISSVSAGSGNMFGETSEKTVWLHSYEEALALAKKENKPIFIDFTGWTCTNCRWMESNVFPLQQVQNYFKDMINVKLYTDRRKEPELGNKEFQKTKFNSIELPLYVILTPEEELVGTKAFTRDLQEFLDFLEKGVKS